MKKRSIFAATAAVAVFATAAYAAVTFDPANGIGFAGKGDVQLALGYSNSQIQAAANELDFTYVKTEVFEKQCQYRDGSGRDAVWVPNGTKITETGINSDIAYDARKRNQVNGFNLKGLDSSVTIEESEACPDGSLPNGETLQDDTIEELRVSHGTNTGVIWKDGASVH